ncbi:MAG TPA: phosphatase PAP2 family protein [Coleofasciculaceae cyanobacterium]|jgi:undecaprenyl-diphosphatase
MQTPNTADFWLLKQLNHGMASSYFFTKQAILFNNLNLLELIMAAVLVYWWFSKDSKTSSTVNLRHRVLLVLLSCLPTYVVARISQSIFHRPRPLINMPLEIPPIFQAQFKEMREAFTGFGSFPSDHAGLFFLFTTIVFTVNKRLGIFCLLVSLYYCALRVAVGYHWPSDILGGAVLGSLVALLMLSLEPRLNKILKNFVSQAERYPGIIYTVSFLFLCDFSQSFTNLKILADALGKRVFH